MKQKPVAGVSRRVDWKALLRLCEFHKVAGLVYSGILGLENDSLPPQCKEEFLLRFKKEMLLNEAYRSAEEVLAWQLNARGLHGLFLTGSQVQGLYREPELAHIDQIELLLEKEGEAVFGGLMESMGYSKEEDRLWGGVVYTRAPGLRVFLRTEIPCAGERVFKDFFPASVRSYRRKSGGYVHALGREQRYIYHCVRLAELYARGLLRIREILDFRLYARSVFLALSWDDVIGLLTKAGLKEFIDQINLLSALWFDEDGRRDYAIALELEDYILLNGKESLSLDERLLPKRRIRLDFYSRDREREWSQRKKEWLFPKREDLSGAYPILDRLPFLLVFFWLARLARLGRRLAANYIRRLISRARERLFKIKERLLGFFKRKGRAGRGRAGEADRENIQEEERQGDEEHHYEEEIYHRL